MRVALSFDMEGVSGITTVPEILPVADAYWESGRTALHRDVVAAAEGLLDAGADEVVCLDNHGAGNPSNIGGLPLPEGARLETWHVFDLRDHDVDAQLQVGYHARGGVEGFISHTYVPWLRLRADGELISESHGRVWGAGVPLLGIVGNDLHEQTLGSLASTPYLVVQDTVSHSEATPHFSDPEEGHDAIRRFARTALENGGVAIDPPRDVTFEASIKSPDEAAPIMEEGGWRRSGDHTFSVELRDWQEARELINTAMPAAIQPFMRIWAGDLTSPEARETYPESQLEEIERLFADWAAGSEPEWF